MKIKNIITNTEPCAFHLNGGYDNNKYGHSICTQFKENYGNIKKENLERMLHLVLYAWK